MSADLIAEAKEEWKSRGYDPILFELDKMLEIWKMEEDADLQDRANRGENMLDDKMETIMANGLETNYTKEFKMGLKSLWKDVKGELKALKNDTKDALETPWQRRARLKKAFLLRMDEDKKSHESFLKTQKSKASDRRAKLYVLRLTKSVWRIRFVVCAKPREWRRRNKKRPRRRKNGKRWKMQARKDELARVIKVRNKAKRIGKQRRVEKTTRAEASESNWKEHSLNMKRKTGFGCKRSRLRRSAKWKRRKTLERGACARGASLGRRALGTCDGQWSGGVFNVPLSPGEFRCPIPGKGGHRETDEGMVSLQE